MRHNLLRSLSLLAAFALSVSAACPWLAAAEGETDVQPTPAAADSEDLALAASKADGYTTYIAQYADWNTKVPSIEIAGSAFSGSSGAEVKEDFRGLGKACAVIPDDGWAEWTFEVPQDGLYQVELAYMAADEASGDVELAATVDGALPFREMNAQAFKRRYVQNGEITTNKAGNDVKPEVTEVFVWSEASLRDSSGYVQEPFLLALKAGAHTLRLTGSRGSLAVQALTLREGDTHPAYADYLAYHREQGHEVIEASGISPIQAEDLAYKTDLSILPTADRSSPYTTPQSAANSRLNTVGGSNWKRIGEAVTWTVDVKQAGLYRIAPRYRQNILDGIFTSRRLLIDGEVPFAEAAALRFEYNSDWQLEPLGGAEDPYLFYLDEGTHTLTLEVAIGDVAEVIGMVQEAQTQLNAVYRKIIMISGPSPDQYRDYNFEALIPDEIAELAKQRDALQHVVDFIDQQTGADGSYTSIMKKIIFQLDKMAEKPASIAKYLEQFKANLGSLGTWLMTASEQPLQIDCLYLVGSSDELPKADAGFFGSAWFGLQSFFYSFFADYSSVGQGGGEVYDRSLKVWVQTGRDQAEILRQLIDTGFSQEQKAAVELELVPAGTLLQSVLAGLGPDVVLNNAASEPINYAVRNAVEDLTQFPDFEEVAEWFHPSALVPYTYQGKVYALPETFSFLMFFYRKDIFEEAELEVPETWEDLIELIPDLQRRNLEMAFPKDLNAYALLLYQNGGELYVNEGESTNLNSNTALNTFVEFTEMFTLYDLPFTYDFANRFRSGEMPCGIADYTVYNQLTVFAPEIKGLWDFIPVPGKTDAEGNSTSVSVGTGMGDMILTGAKDKELAWEFLKWWMRADTQSTFAKDMETVLGPAGKQPTANMEALTNMTWTSHEYGNLLSQLETVRAVPEVPGGYYLSRVITFALNRVYNGSGTQNMAENPVEVLSEYIQELNDELTRKREEFGIR